MNIYFLNPFPLYTQREKRLYSSRLFAYVCVCYFRLSIQNLICLQSWTFQAIQRKQSIICSSIAHRGDNNCSYNFQMANIWYHHKRTKSPAKLQPNIWYQGEEKQQKFQSELLFGSKVQWTEITQIKQRIIVSANTDFLCDVIFVTFFLWCSNSYMIRTTSRKVLQNFGFSQKGPERSHRCPEGTIVSIWLR